MKKQTRTEIKTWDDVPECCKINLLLGIERGEITGRQEMLKDVLDFITKKGYRHSCYEIDELVKWLKEKLV